VADNPDDLRSVTEQELDRTRATHRYRGLSVMSAIRRVELAPQYGRASAQSGRRHRHDQSVARPRQRQHDQSVRDRRSRYEAESHRAGAADRSRQLGTRDVAKGRVRPQMAGIAVKTISS